MRGVFRRSRRSVTIIAIIRTYAARANNAARFLFLFLLSAEIKKVGKIIVCHFEPEHREGEKSLAVDVLKKSTARDPECNEG